MSFIARTLIPSISLINCSRVIKPLRTNLRSFNSSAKCFSDRKYSPKHEWVTNENGIGTVGITSYAEKSLGDVVYVQLPEVGDTVSAHDEVGAVESVKAASEIYTPVSGTIKEINEQLEDKPGLVNSSCYNDGWLFKIEMKDTKEYDSLMDDKGYEEFLKTGGH